MSSKLSTVIGAAALLAAAGAQAQSTHVTVYGSIDQYLNYMRSSSGASIKALQDGSMLRSRLGFRGLEDLGGGVSAKFNVEMGLNATTGAAADASRSFDRQAWAGLATPYGEVRLGRQNTIIFSRGDYIDYTSRTLGSLVNSFGVPSRYDDDVAYFSPRMAGFQVDAHLNLPGTPAGTLKQSVFQAGVDYLNGPVRVGYAGLRGKAPAGATVKDDVAYDNFYGNYDYGQGKVYLVVIRSNNNTSSGSGDTLINNGAAILGNVGGMVAGTNTDAQKFYRIVQGSVDYKITPALRVGTLWGRITDTSGRGRNATGGSIGAYYDLSKRTTLLALVDTVRNDAGAGFRLAGSAGLTQNFTAANDVNGRSIKGVQTGIVHRF
jgi:predicted porin